MKSLIIGLISSFVLVFTANLSAQEVKTAAPAAQPAPRTAKKAAKSKKPKGLFKDDFDGDVGIKYIGSEPLPEAEIGKVKESNRTDEPVKSKKAAKSASKSTTKSVGQTTSEVGTPPAEAAKMTEQAVKTVSETPSTKAVEPKMTPKSVKVAPKTAEKSAEKSVIPSDAGKIKETQAEMTSTKIEAKPIVMDVVKTPTVEIVKAEPAATVVKSSNPTPTKPLHKPSVRGPHIEFEKMTIDLGNLREDAVVERYFEFKNTGSTTLEILDCRGSCGCIQPKAMSTIIEPGESGQIYVKYVARNKVGPQRPVVTLTTNCSPSVSRLFIETWVDQIPGGVKDTTSQTKSENN